MPDIVCKLELIINKFNKVVSYQDLEKILFSKIAHPSLFVRTTPLLVILFILVIFLFPPCAAHFISKSCFSLLKVSRKVHLFIFNYPLKYDKTLVT